MDKAQLSEILEGIRNHFTPEELAKQLGLDDLLRKKSLLSKPAILRHIEAGNIIIHPYDERNLKSVSYDVTLGEHFYRETNPVGGAAVLNPYDERSVRRNWKHYTAERAEDVSKETGIGFGDNIKPDNKIILLAPGETILAHTKEFIGGRNVVTTMMKARSSSGRNFIEVCKCAGWGDVGYFNRWTMEITNNSNNHPIPIVVGRRIAQIAFFEVEPIQETDVYSKDGKYQSAMTVQELEAKWTPEEMLPKMWKDWEVKE